MFAIRTVTRTAAAVAALLIVTGGANAAASDPAGPAKAATSKQAVEASADSRRYCVVTRTTGSLLPRKECRTRTDWIARTGIDPAAKQ